jgi:hypothetical protein
VQAGIGSVIGPPDEFGEILKILQKMRLWSRKTKLLVMAVLVLAAGAKADTLIPTTVVSPSDNGDSTVMFPRGLRLVTLYGGIAEQPTGLREQLAFCTAGLNYYFADNWAFGFEFTGLGAAQAEDDIAAGGAGIILRTHVWSNQRLSIYGDIALGMLEADNRIPPSGTDFNFTMQSGVGTAIRLNQHTDFMVGIRYFHLSNARQHGPDRNPSLNGIEGYAGIMFRM